MSVCESKILNSLFYITEKTKVEPEIGLILGSGMGILADMIDEPDIIPYKNIPYFPVSTVEGHKGQFVLGRIGGKTVICMQGRFHFYEGYSMQDITYPVRVMKRLGVQKLIVTNAAGGINRGFTPGNLMLIRDHINLLGTNPLIGSNEENFGPRFPDMTEAYSKRLGKIAFDVAASLAIELKQGVYAATTGPSYETPAEIDYLRIIKADAVGMSTVPEVIVANHNGIEVLGISCITNMAAGIMSKPLEHNEVIEVANNIKDQFIALITGIIEKL